MDLRESLNGILIHRLPKEYKTEALAHFSNKSFTYCKHDEKGLQIFFNEYHLAKESIIKKTMLVKRTRYSIYPLVTNLTLHGFRPYANKYTIKTLAKTFGSIIDLYEIQKKYNHNDKKLLITNDYRIILDIPEVLANLDLAPLTFPGLNIQFPVTFFCRLCRQNGHKQHQCTNVFAQDTENAPKPANRQMSYDAPPNRREALPSQNAVQYNAGTLHKRIPEVLPQILKVQDGKVIVTERDLKSTKIEKKWVRKHENSEYHHKESLNRHVEALSNSNPKGSESVNNHNHPRSVKQTTLMLPKGNESKTVFKSPGGGKSESYRQHFKTVHQKGSRDASTKECNSVTTEPLTGARVTQSRKPVLSRILPPGIEIKDIQKIIGDRNEFGFRNLTPDKEETLAYVVRWNSKQHPRQNLEEHERRFLKHIKRFLNIARRAKTERSSAESWSNDPKMRRHQEQRSSIGERKENQTASPTTSKTRSRRTSISPGITQAINRTKGILEPSLLVKFLMQVWGRKNISAVASHFTTDLSALVAQLEQVVLIYYCRGRGRGASEDRDIRWIEGLCSRLKGNSESSAQHFDTQHASKIQSLRTSLSPGIAKAISEVNGGVLEPELLTNFLVQVRNRRKLLEVAKHFTTDIGALVAQLEQVIDAYYCCSDQKDVAGEQDVRRIKGVCQRLQNGEGASAQQPASNFTNVHRSPSQVAMKTERVFPPNPHVPHVFTKPEPTIIRMYIKTEPTEE